MRSARIAAVLALVMMMIVLLPVALAAYKVTVYVYDETGKAVKGAVVTVYSTAAKVVAKCTTNETGACTVEVPENTTYGYLATLSTAKYGLVVLDYVRPTVVINCSAMYYAKLLTNTTYDIPVKIRPAKFTADIEVIKTNATLYANTAINVTYPKEYRVTPLQIAKFVKLRYDTTTTNATTVYLDMTRNYEVMAYYQIVYAIAPNILMIIAAVFVMLIIIAILIALARRRRRAEAAATEFS